jgi:hypothetical protein
LLSILLFFKMPLKSQHLTESQPVALKRENCSHYPE